MCVSNEHTKHEAQQAVRSRTASVGPVASGSLLAKGTSVETREARV